MASAASALGMQLLLPVVLAAALLTSLGLALPQDNVKHLLIPVGDGSYGSLADTFYAVSVLKAIDDASLDVTKTSAWVSKQTLDSSPVTAARLAALSTLVSSKASEEVTAAEKALIEAATSATTLKEAYLAIEGLQYLKAKGWSSADPKGAAKAVLALLEGLKQGDGLWKLNKEEKDASPFASGLALKSLAGVLILDPSTKSSVEALLKDTKALFSQAASKDSQLFFDGGLQEGGALPATALIASGYITLASALDSPLGVAPKAVAGVAQFLASAAAPRSLHEVYLLFDALKALDSNSLAVPVIASLPGQYSLSSKGPAPAISLTTVLGKPVEGASVTLSSAKLTAKGSTGSKALGKPTDLVATGASYALPADVLGPSAALGTYTLKIEVASSSPSHVAVSPVTLSLVTTAVIGISPVSIEVLDSDQGEPEAQAKVELEAGASLAALSATHLQKLKFSVSLTDSKGKRFGPQQAFLTLKHESGVTHYFLLKPDGNDLSLKIDILESLEKLYYLSGVYSAWLTLGDLYQENSGTWPLGSIDLDLPEAPDGAASAPAVAVTVTERFGPQAEIAHIFRIPDKRPPHAVSFFFMFLALAPLLVLIAGLLALGVNLKLLPTSGVPFLAAVGFHGGITAILLLYVAFWVMVKLFTTIKILLLLAFLTAIPGHYILSFLANSPAKAKTS